MDGRYAKSKQVICIKISSTKDNLDNPDNPDNSQECCACMEHLDSTNDLDTTTCYNCANTFHTHCVEHIKQFNSEHCCQCDHIHPQMRCPTCRQSMVFDCTRSKMLYLNNTAADITDQLVILENNGILFMVGEFGRPLFVSFIIIFLEFLMF